MVRDIASTRPNTGHRRHYRSYGEGNLVEQAGAVVFQKSYTISGQLLYGGYEGLRYQHKRMNVLSRH